MEKSNVIISIIIVVCIAAGVAAYGLTNSDNAIFSDLAGVDSGDDKGGNGLNLSNGSGINIETGGSGSGSSVSGGSGSGSSSGSGSGSSSSHSSGGGSHTPSKPVTPSKITKTQAQNIANNHITQSGCYAGPAEDQGSYYFVPVLSSSGQKVGYFLISYGGKVIEGAGGAP